MTALIKKLYTTWGKEREREGTRDEKADGMGPGGKGGKKTISKGKNEEGGAREQGWIGGKDVII